MILRGRRHSSPKLANTKNVKLLFAVPLLHVKTVSQGNWNYKQAWVTTDGLDYVVIGIKAAGNAQLVFSERAGDDTGAVYEVVLGSHSNANTIMRHCVYCVNLVFMSTPGIVSSDEFRYFWFSWASDTSSLRVGRGSIVGEELVASLAHTNSSNIAGVGVSTGWGSSGEWHLGDLEGK